MNAYTYDGGGQRVRKLVGENTRFVYGLSGQLIAEFDGSTGNLKKEYLYGGATLITIEPTAVNANGTQYTALDNLGSPRVITNQSGSVVSRHDYRPFGEELCAGTGGRSTGMGFCGGGDTNRKKFTGYERDAETGLDFAQARYFSSTEGRFTSPDTLLGSLANPQSLNRYAYVGNNPLGYSDPTGHLPVAVTGPAPGAWGDSDSPATPGDLPARYEEEIAGIKAVIAANRSAGAGGLGSAAALCGSNDEAPEHVDEAGHSGEQATEGGGTETTATPEIRWDAAELLDGDKVLRTASFEGTFSNEATLNVEHSRVGNVDNGAAFNVRVNFNLPKYADPDSFEKKSFIRLAADNRWQYYKSPTGAKPVEFSADGRAASVVIRLQQRDFEGRNNHLIISIQGNYGNGDAFSGQATVHLVTKAYSPPQQPIFKKP